MSDDNGMLSSDEVKAKVAEDFGLDPVEHEAHIEKIANERIENQKKLSKTIEQKAKYRELGVKAGILDPSTFEPIEKKPDGTLNKPNNEQGGLSREETIFFAKHQGTPEEADKDFQLAKKIAQVEGISILAAMEDEVYKEKIAKREIEKQAKRNSMGASGGSQSLGGHAEKPVSQMTEEEHKAYFKKRVGL